MDLGPDPVHGVAHQPHALVGVEALDGLHQADVAFLDQVTVRQTVAQVLARDGDDQAQVRQHQLAGGIEVVVAPEGAGVFLFLLEREQGQPVHGRDVSVEIAQRRHHRPRVCDCQSRAGGSR